MTIQYSPLCDHDTNLSTILEKINNDPSITIISFDVFDTAVVRPFLQPTDLFTFMTPMVRDLTGLINYKFADGRVTAEREIRKEIENKKARREPTLHEIYARLGSMSSLDKNTTDKIYQFEVDLEIRLTYANLTIFELFEYIKKIEKRIVFCSDSYLDTNTIKKILTSSGYSGFEDVIVSSDCDATKHHGELFDVLCQKLKATPKAILHFGDNKWSDVEQARTHGIRSQLIISPKEILQNKKSAHRELWHTPHTLDFPISIFLALVGNKSCSALYPASNQSLFGNSLHMFGYYAVGIFLYSFLAWMRRQAMLMGIDHIFFLSRDGYLPLHAWNSMHFSDNNGPSASYLHISRRAMVPVAMYYGDIASSVAFLPVSANSTVKDFIESRLDSDIAEKILQRCKKCGILPEMNAKKQMDSIISFFIENKEFTKELVRPAAEKTIAYFNSHFGQAKEVAIFDVGRKGTYQNLLSRALQKRIFGFYVLTEGEISTNVAASDHIAFLGQQIVCSPFTKCDTVPYEVFLSETGPSVAGWNEDGSPCFKEESATDENTASAIAKIQNGALDLMNTVYTMFGHSLLRYDVNPQLANNVFWGFWNKEKDVAVLKEIHHEDSSFHIQRRPLIDHYVARQPNIIKGKHVVIYTPAMTKAADATERTAAYLCNYLVDHGYSVSMITRGSIHTKNPIPVYPLPESVVVRHVNPTQNKSIRETLAVLRPDTLIVMSSSDLVINFIKSTRGKRIPVMLVEQNEPSVSLNRYWSKSKKHLYTSTYAKAQMTSVQLPSYKSFFPLWMRRNVTVLQNPIAILPKEKKIERQNIIIICYAQIILEKNQPYLVIEALSQLMDKFPEWEVHIYDSEYTDGGAYLSGLLKAKNLSNQISFNGHTDDMAKDYPLASIFVVLSKYEGFPNSLAEALASGLPAVGLKNCSNTRELIKDGENGILVNDVTGLTAALAELASSPEKRAAMSEKAVISMKQYGMEEALNNWLCSIDNLLNKKHNIFSSVGPVWLRVYRPLVIVYKFIKKYAPNQQKA